MIGRMLAIFLITGVALVTAHPAAARPRDDVMGNIYRCSVIADSRQWLDCYYGAAQPARAALGLAPALPAQVRLAMAPPGGGAPQDEAIRDDVIAAATGCMRTGGERAWLDCYYAAATPMRMRLGLVAPAARAAIAAPPSPKQVAAAGPPPMPRNTSMFNGIFNNVRPIVRKVPMQSFTLDRNGAFTVTLADGEVWKQAAEDEVYHPAHWGHAGPDTLVTIAPDTMHTFTMTVEGEQRFYKVHRIH